MLAPGANRRRQRDARLVAGRFATDGLATSFFALAGDLDPLRAGAAFVVFLGSEATALNARAIQRRSSAGWTITLSGSMTLSLRTRPLPIGSKGAAPSSASAAARSASV